MLMRSKFPSICSCWGLLKTSASKRRYLSTQMTQVSVSADDTQMTSTGRGVTYASSMENNLNVSLAENKPDI